MALSRLCVALVLGMSSFTALAQVVSLTPQQEAMLNQLPPAQRQEALRALAQMRQSGGDDSQLSSLSEEQSAPSSAPSDAMLGDPIRAAEPPRISGQSAVIINLLPKSDLPRDDALILANDAALQGISGTRFYELGEDGVVELPGLTRISLLGLTEEQIEQRLAAEPSLRFFNIGANILDSTATGVSALKPFGYDVFESPDYSFDPVMTGPVPADYVLGPGDSVRVQLFGNVNAVYEFEVSREGVLNLPELGPVTVAGLSFTEFRQDMNRRVQEMLIGTQVSVTMGRLRTIRVFVLGDANRPGSFVVSSLATISNALYRSGGISRVGSLRDIQLKRNGTTVSRFDLYDLLLSGDTSGDARLQPGDAIFIPPVGPQVSVGGAVRRPAIYETRGNASVADIIRMAGGLKPEAYPGGARIERIETGADRTVISVNAAGSESASTPLRAGDIVTVPEVLPILERTVLLEGHVHRPGPYQWRPGMRLTDLLGSSSFLQPGADTDYILIRREQAGSRRVSAVSANLSAALADPSSSENIALQPRDTLHVFSLAYGRQRIVQPLLDELQTQSRFDEPYREVSVSGRVKAPGNYPLESGMQVSDLIRAGGNLTEEAYAVKAELVRYEIAGNEYRTTEVIDVDLDAILRGDASADIALQEHDNLRISGLPDWDSLWTINLEGEFTFPGEYRIRRGEKLSDILERAGGLTDAAFPEGAIFLRESLREREQEQIEVLARRLEADLNALSLEAGDSRSTDSVATGQSLLAQLRSTEALGRLVINLDDLVRANDRSRGIYDLELRNGDRLLVPKQAQEVTVIGETQQNTSHLYQSDMSRDDYIAMSGGLTRRADKKLIYVVRANGAVVTGNQSKWFVRRQPRDIRPGDTIVVPLETDRIRPLTLWSNVTQILYQAAIAVAAIDTFGN